MNPQPTRTLTLVLAACALAVLSGCPDDDTCTNGATQACTCTDGRAGAQTCSAGAFGACTCTGPMDGGARDAQLPDAPRDASEPVDTGEHDTGVADAYPDAAPDASADAAPDAEPTDAGFPAFCERFPTGYAEIPPGTFLMGTPDAQLPPGMFFMGEVPQHRVEITRRFWMKATEVTHAEWDEVMGQGTNPSFMMGCSTCPVEQVTWHLAVDYVNRLSVLCGLPTCYPAMAADREGANLDLDCSGFRLPTEAEWEYAARAGTTTEVWAGNVGRAATSTVANLIAWYEGNSIQLVRGVGAKLPNPWGLYDTSGNVDEWVSDGGRTYDTAVPLLRDPMGDGRMIGRVRRGGNVSSTPLIIRSAMRTLGGAAQVDRTIGFRVARTHR